MWMGRGTSFGPTVFVFPQRDETRRDETSTLNKETSLRVSRLNRSQPPFSSPLSSTYLQCPAMHARIDRRDSTLETPTRDRHTAVVDTRHPAGARHERSQRHLRPLSLSPKTFPTYPTAGYSVAPGRALTRVPGRLRKSLIPPKYCCTERRETTHIANMCKLWPSSLLK